MKLTRTVVCLVACVCAAFSQGGARAQSARPQPAARPLPSPVLVFMGPENYESGGKQWTRYHYAVDNQSAYPKELFAAAPALPPCGQNARASRTWVDLYDAGGKRLNGFCSLGGPEGLGRLWFALEADAVPPSWVYMEMTDRQTNTKYKSNLAESTL